MPSLAGGPAPSSSAAALHPGRATLPWRAALALPCTRLPGASTSSSLFLFLSFFSSSLSLSQHFWDAGVQQWLLMAGCDWLLKAARTLVETGPPSILAASGSAGGPFPLTWAASPRTLLHLRPLPGAGLLSPAGLVPERRRLLTALTLQRRPRRRAERAASAVLWTPSHCTRTSGRLKGS